MTTDPLDLGDLLAAGPPQTGAPYLLPDGTIGHVHLHVSNLGDAETFYVGLLGFDLMQRFGASAVRFSRRLSPSRRPQHVGRCRRRRRRRLTR